MSNIPKTRKENSSTIGGPSKSNQTHSFKFDMKHVHKLKLALAALCDCDFNPKGIGRIYVDHKGFGVTVCNRESCVTSNLWLNATGLINFECSRPVKSKVVQLSEIYKNLVDADDADSVTIRLPDGSTDIQFVFGRPEPREFSIALLETDAEFEAFNNIIFFCEAAVPTECLWWIMQLPVRKETQTVAAKMTAENVKFMDLKRRKTVEYEYDDERSGGTRGLQLEDDPSAWFNCNHGERESLKKACSLDNVFLVCFLTNPSKKVMFRFNLRELGDLVYVMETTEFFPNGLTREPLKVALLALEAQAAAEK